MRVTVDTNVLVSAFISKNGICAYVLDLTATFDGITLVLSDEILAEFAEVMGRDEVRQRLGARAKAAAEYEKAVRDIAEVVEVSSNFRVIKEDPDDNVFLNVGVDGKVEYIVSGDRHLKQLRRFKKIRIVSPKTFLGIVTRMFGDLVLSSSESEPA